MANKGAARKQAGVPAIGSSTKARILEGLRRGMQPEPLFNMCNLYLTEVEHYCVHDETFAADMQVAIERGKDADRIELFLDLVSEGFKRRPAMKLAGIGPVTLFGARRKDPDFDKRLDEAEEHATELLEQEGFRRAIGGSDLLLMFLLKGRKPHIYRENPPPPPPPEDEPAIVQGDTFKLATRTAFILARARHLAKQAQKQIELDPAAVKEVAPDE